MKNCIKSTIAVSLAVLSWCWEQKDIYKQALIAENCNNSKKKVCVIAKDTTKEDIYTLLNHSSVAEVKEWNNNIDFLLENLAELSEKKLLHKFNDEIILKAFLLSSDENISNKTILKNFIEEKKMKENFKTDNFQKLLEIIPADNAFKVYDFFQPKMNITEFLPLIANPIEFIYANFLEIKKRGLLESKISFFNIKNVILVYLRKNNGKNNEMKDFLYEKVEEELWNSLDEWKTELVLVWLQGKRRLEFSKKNIKNIIWEIWILSHYLDSDLEWSIMKDSFDDKKVSKYEKVELILIALKSNNIPISTKNVNAIYKIINTLSQINYNVYFPYNKSFFLDKWIKNFLKIDKKLIRNNEDRLIVARNLYEKNLEPSDENVKEEYESVLKMRKEIWEIPIYNNRNVYVIADWIERGDKFNWDIWFNKNTEESIKKQEVKNLTTFKYKKWDNAYVHKKNFLDAMKYSPKDENTTFEFRSHWGYSFNKKEVRFFINKSTSITHEELAEAYIQRNIWREDIETNQRDIFNFANCFSYNFSKKFQKTIQKYNVQNWTNIQMPIILNETDWPFQLSVLNHRSKYNSNLMNKLFENWKIKIKHYMELNDYYRSTNLSVFNWWYQVRSVKPVHTPSI